MKIKYKFSVVIPVYNEEAILRKSIELLISDIHTINQFDIEYEIIICENGSSDNSYQIAKQLADEFPVVRVEHLESSGYGQALKLGISAANYERIVIFNIDFWDIEFLKKTLILLDKYDFIVGSKVITGAVDKRPLVRRLITRWFNLFLRLLYGFRGTDTHGIKGLRKSAVYPVAMQCLTEREVFDTELLLRADRARISIHELPVTIQERRLSKLNLFRRIPSTASDLLRLYIALQFKPTITTRVSYYEHGRSGEYSLGAYQKIKMLYGKLTEEEISFVTEIPIPIIRELQETIRLENDSSS